jgi:hypothetical protein
MYLRIFGRFNPPKIRSANSKERFCSQIANPQIATFLEGLQILQVLYVRKCANLQFAELVREPTHLEPSHMEITGQFQVFTR